MLMLGHRQTETGADADRHTERLRCRYMRIQMYTQVETQKKMQIHIQSSCAFQARRKKALFPEAFLSEILWWANKNLHRFRKHRHAFLCQC